MKIPLFLPNIPKSKIVKQLWHSFKLANTDVLETTLKKEHFKPQLYFWIAVFGVYILDTVPLQGWGLGIDNYGWIQKLYDKEHFNKLPKPQGLVFTICTLGMGIICSYLNLILFKWIKYFDESANSHSHLKEYHSIGGNNITPYNFSNSTYFRIYLFVFIILGYIGALVMGIIAKRYIDFSGMVIFDFGKVGSVLNFATPLRQMPECLIIMWAFLGFDFYLKYAARLKEWGEEREQEILRIKQLEEDQALARHQQEIKMIEARNKTIQLQMLQTRIKPHFLLNIIRLAFNRVEEFDKEVASDLEKLSHVLRYTVAVSEEKIEKIKLKDEARYLKELIDLKKYYNNNLVVSVNIPNYMLEEDILLIEQGILDEFILNAFKYGASDTEEVIKPYIKLSLTIDDENRLNFDIENSTLIYNKYPTNTYSSGVGLQNVKMRLEILYPHTHTLTIEDQIKGMYKVHLEIDINNDEE